MYYTYILNCTHVLYTFTQVIFLVRPVLSLMDTIAAYIQREERSGGSGVRTEYR